MSPEVWAAIVSGVFLVLVAIITTVAGVVLPKLLAQGRNIKVIRDQVENSHGTNFRDDLDALRYEMRYGFGLVHERLHRLENKHDG